MGTDDASIADLKARYGVEFPGIFADDPIIANKRTYWEANAQITRKIRIS